MCKPFPPPLVRGGVFLVGSDTKYRDIADGNFSLGLGSSRLHLGPDTKYRDISAIYHLPREQFLPVRQLAPTMTDKIKVGSA